jgi:acid phosphatase family membrane protein YuiD
MVLCRYKEKRWDARQFIASGGMPSSHSATVTALAVSVGIQEGFRSATFATSMILACVVSTCLKFFIQSFIITR